MSRKASKSQITEAVITAILDQHVQALSELNAYCMGLPTVQKNVDPTTALGIIADGIFKFEILVDSIAELRKQFHNEIALITKFNRERDRTTTGVFSEDVTKILLHYCDNTELVRKVVEFGKRVTECRQLLAQKGYSEMNKKKQLGIKSRVLDVFSEMYPEGTIKGIVASLTDTWEASVDTKNWTIRQLISGFTRGTALEYNDLNPSEDPPSYLDSESSIIKVPSFQREYLGQNIRGTENVRFTGIIKSCMASSEVKKMIQPIILVSTSPDNYLLQDGLQRVSTFLAFVNNKCPIIVSIPNEAGKVEAIKLFFSQLTEEEQIEYLNMQYPVKTIKYSPPEGTLEEEAQLGIYERAAAQFCVLNGLGYPLNANALLKAKCPESAVECVNKTVMACKHLEMYPKYSQPSASDPKENSSLIEAMLLRVLHLLFMPNLGSINWRAYDWDANVPTELKAVLINDEEAFKNLSSLLINVVSMLLTDGITLVSYRQRKGVAYSLNMLEAFLFAVLKTCLISEDLRCILTSGTEEDIKAFADSMVAKANSLIGLTSNFIENSTASTKDSKRFCAVNISAVTNSPVITGRLPAAACIVLAATQELIPSESSLSIYSYGF